MFTKISIFFVVGFIHWSTAELRWCRVSNVESGSARDGWVQFEDTSHSCVECSPDSTVLLESSKLPLFECCNGKIVEVGNCERSLQDETASCSNAIRVSVSFNMTLVKNFEVLLFCNVRYFAVVHATNKGLIAFEVRSNTILSKSWSLHTF